VCIRYLRLYPDTAVTPLEVLIFILVLVTHVHTTDIGTKFSTGIAINLLDTKFSIDIYTRVPLTIGHRRWRFCISAGRASMYYQYLGTMGIKGKQLKIGAVSMGQ
jgi:hypothetical protein